MPRSGESMGVGSSGKMLAYWHIIATSLYINTELLTMLVTATHSRFPETLEVIKSISDSVRGKKKKKCLNDCGIKSSCLVQERMKH